jgi:hypothetical protein
MTDRQPDFVIVGATKSATTWLQRNLQQHSAVFMPGTETHYFSWCFGRGPAWYGAFFEPAAAHQIVGEKSTSYLDHPEAARRLRETLPEVRLVVQLRNPIERAFAHYRMDFRRGEVSADIGRHLCAYGPDAARLLAGGRYFGHVARFFELFPREQLCVTLYDDLDREPASVLERIRAHIGLATPGGGAPAIEPIEPVEPTDDAAEARTAPTPRRRPAPLEGLVKPFGDGAWRRRTGAAAGPVACPELSDAIRDELRTYYQDDVRALSQLLGRDLSSWLAPARALV